MLGRPALFAFVLLLSFAPCVTAKKKPPTQPININTADSAQLQLVPGIGPATAEKILQMRKSYGAFRSVNDLMAIRGIGPKRLEKMRKYLTVNRPTPAHAAKPASCSACSKHKARPPTKPAAVPKSQASKPDTPEPDAESEEP